MTDPKEKGKPSVPTRQPQKKTKAGMFDNLRPLPAHPVEEILGLSQPAPTRPNPPQPAPTRPKTETAPARDFNRRANSLERDALPKGLFPGTSKKLYDALYLKTRGAIVPARTVQATKRELMSWSGIKSKNTIAVNLSLLTANGLIVRHIEIGDHEGSIYEVILPEEVPDPTHPNPSQPNPTQKLGLDPTQFLGWVGLGNPIENKDTYEPSKTSFKTKDINTDDELTPLREAAKEITGKEASDWREVAEVLAAELKIAAGRTTVSSAPAFLAEHLRRRLFKKDKAELQREVKNVPTGQGSAAPADSKDCPTCFGTGLFYPDGFDKGVKRCNHEKLIGN